jgi:hypothetical protein
MRRPVRHRLGIIEQLHRHLEVACARHRCQYSVPGDLMLDRIASKGLC